MDNNRDNSKTNTGTVFTPGSASWRILIVDDNDLYRQLLNDYLVDCGYQVLSVADGSNFFQVLAQFQPHLILLDLRLPGIDGYTLLAQIQQKTEWRHIPVIVVSAFAYKADQKRALSLRARRYFVKPMNLTALIEAIQEELGPG